MFKPFRELLIIRIIRIGLLGIERHITHTMILTSALLISLSHQTRLLLFLRWRQLAVLYIILQVKTWVRS